MRRTRGTGFPIWRAVFLLLVGTGLVVTFVRFRDGLGAVSNLSDRYPWGIWIGFDLLCGIGLAAGGFVVTSAVYVFNLKRYQPIVRPAILTTFLGYMLAIVALWIDLGRPWNIWHPLIMWNPHSPLFEVAWCVMLYSTVLALEFSGMVFERLRWARAVKAQKMLTVPLVIVGVILSTLHQSSLGSLYLIVPGKLHAIWYSPMLPIMFFLSAVMAGLAMVIVEARLSARAFGRTLEMPLLSNLARTLVGVMGILLVIRAFDLWDRGAMGAAFDLSYESCMLLLELGVGLALPLALLSIRAIRRRAKTLYGASLLVVLGFVINRLNVSITGFESAQGGQYVPSFGEISITLMLVALGFGAFSLAVRHLNVYPSEAPDPRASSERPLPARKPRVPQGIADVVHADAGHPTPSPSAR